MLLGALALFAALHSPSEAVRAHALRPLIVREAKAHRLPAHVLERMAHRESQSKIGAIGDHGKGIGLLQVHADAIPWKHYTRAQLLHPDVNVHVACLRLVLARHRCGGGPARYAANYNGARCGRDVYGLLAAK